MSSHRDIVVLPKLTDEGYRVTIFRIRPEYPESAADVANAVRAVLLTSDVRMFDEHQIAGDVFVYEVSKEYKGTDERRCKYHRSMYISMKLLIFIMVLAYMRRIVTGLLPYRFEH